MESTAPDAGIAQCILDNARRIQGLGQHIGMFEFTLFAWHHRVDVVIHYGPQIWHVVDRYVPSLSTRHRERIARPGGAHECHVEWCRLGDAGSLFCAQPSGSMGLDASVGHFVLLFACGPVVVDDVNDSSTAWPDTVQEAAGRLGFFVVETVVDGNCGVDCMAQFLGLARTAYFWKKLRAWLARQSMEVCGQPVWQAALVAAGEMPGVIPKATLKATQLCNRSARGVRLNFRRWMLGGIGQHATGETDPYKLVSPVTTTHTGPGVSSAGDGVASSGNVVPAAGPGVPNDDARASSTTHQGVEETLVPNSTAAKMTGPAATCTWAL